MKSYLFLLMLTTFPSQASVLTNGSFETGDFSAFTLDSFLDFNAAPSGIPGYQTFLAAQNDPTRTTGPVAGGVENSQTMTFDGAGVSGPPVLPTNGTFLAFLSNESAAGDGTLTGSSISQTFTIPIGSPIFSFDIALLNDDAAPALAFDDFGGVAILSGITMISQYNIDLVGLGNAGVSAGNPAGGFLNSSPFQSASFDLSALQGQSATVVAYVIQAGDNTTESRLILDNLRLDSTIAVPEPSTLGLVLLVMMLTIGIRRFVNCKI